ncbi:MAG: 1,4-alpha-glucan branching protein domain-containing protein [Bacteroidota bacterium]
MHAGNYVLILHTHLPFVLHHGNWPHGTDWLCEAVAECYIPLLNTFHDLLDEGITPKVTLDISPILCEQLEHPHFKSIFEKYCTEKIEAAQIDRKLFLKEDKNPHFITLTEYWENWFTKRLDDFKNSYDSSIVGALKELQDAGAIEVMTCGATHGYFPLLADDRSIELQVRAAVANYGKHFGRKPRGIWLPECAYRPAYTWQTYLPVEPYNTPTARRGVEEFLKENGIEYFVVDETTVTKATPLGVLRDGHFTSVYAPDYHATHWNFDNTPLSLYRAASGENVSKGTAVAFARHQEVAMQVWSADSGFPGNPAYLDFHKKQNGSQLRYWRVTDLKADMAHKLLYVPEWTRGAAGINAQTFVHSIEKTLLEYRMNSGKEGTLTTPFDTELFGHWWFEGPEFLKEVLRNIHHSQYVNMKTAGEQLDHIQPTEVALLPESSWGRGGHHEVWINDATTWTWESIYKAEQRMNQLCEKTATKTTDDVLKRMMLQALRELMLLQSSDWQFLIETGSARDYAEMRFTNHRSDYNELCDMAEAYLLKKKFTAKDEMFLKAVEMRNPIFPELKLEWWRR